MPTTRLDTTKSVGPNKIYLSDIAVKAVKAVMEKKGKNIISLRNTDPRETVVVVMDDVRFSWSPPSRFTKPKEWQPAPKGPLAVFQPRTDLKTPYEVTGLPGGAAPYVLRALSLVPAELRAWRIVADAQYLGTKQMMSFESTRAIDRSQIELVAGRVSSLNECFY